MPVSTTKKLDLNIRRSAMQQCWDIGFSFADLAFAFDIDISSTRNDARGFPMNLRDIISVETNERRAYTWREGLRLYTSIDLKPEREAVEQVLYKALGRYIDIKRLCSIAEGVAEFANAMINEVASPELIGYRLLLNEIFRVSYPTLTGRKLLQIYLQEIYNSKDLPKAQVFQAREDFAKAMVAWAKKYYQNSFLPCVDGTVKQIIDGIIKEKLSPNTERIIRLRFSLGSPEDETPLGARALTLDECAKKLDVRKEHARQFEAKGLRYLREQLPSESLRYWTTPEYELAEAYIAAKLTPPQLPPLPTHANEKLEKILGRSTEELELSVRTYNILKNANIQTIRDLVKKLKGNS